MIPLHWKHCEPPLRQSLGNIKHKFVLGSIKYYLNGKASDRIKLIYSLQGYYNTVPKNINSHWASKYSYFRMLWLWSYVYRVTLRCYDWFSCIVI